MNLIIVILFFIIHFLALRITYAISRMNLMSELTVFLIYFVPPTIRCVRMSAAARFELCSIFYLDPILSIFKSLFDCLSFNQLLVKLFRKQFTRFVIDLFIGLNTHSYWHACWQEYFSHSLTMASIYKSNFDLVALLAMHHMREWRLHELVLFTRKLLLEGQIK